MSNYSWNLSRPKFFEQFKTTDQTEVKGMKTQSLAFICDDTYYFWRSSTKTIIKAQGSDIWKSDEIDTIYEEWSLSTSIPFHITHLSAQKAPKERCLLWGTFGVAVVTFPKHKKESRIANCNILGEKTYIENPRLSILQAKWHPTNRQSIVMVLNNDNFLRTYNSEEPGVLSSHTAAGPLELVPFRYNEKGSRSVDPPIDFDFGPQLVHMDYWTIFLLKSSGTMSYFLMKLVGSTSRALWEEEKVIPIDGEFEDIFELSASLSVSKTFPLLITIGGLGGSLYHTVLLPQESDTDDEESLNLEDSLVSGDTILFIKEVVVLESDMQLSYLQIVPDPLCSYRYACVHQEGVHLITVNFVPHMMKLLSSGNADRFADTSSTCRYILCCKDDTEKKNDFITAAFSDSIPQKFATVAGNGETLIYDVPKFLPADMNVSEDDVDKSKPFPKLNPVALNAFENVASLLAKTVNQPYLSCPPDLSQEKREALVLDSIRTIQKEYIHKQELAMKFLTVSILNLMERVDELKIPVSILQRAQPSVRAKAEELAEKYEEQNDLQNKLLQRFRNVVSKYKQSLPVMSDEERKWAKKFQEYAAELPSIKEQVDGLLGTIHDRQNNIREEVQLQPEDFGGSPRSKVSAMELLDMKREIIEHQKLLAELTQSIQEINGNLSL